MRSLVLLLCLALTACVPQGAYRVVRGEEVYTGYAISSSRVITALHDVTTLWVVTRRGRQRVKVVERDGNVMVLEGIDGPLDLRPGDSGAAVIGLIVGREIR